LRKILIFTGGLISPQRFSIPRRPLFFPHRLHDDISPLKTLLFRRASLFYIGDHNARPFLKPNDSASRGVNPEGSAEISSGSPCSPVAEGFFPEKTFGDKDRGFEFQGHDNGVARAGVDLERARSFSMT